MGMQLIETIEVGAGGAASIEFTGIPQDGVDLVVLASLRASVATENAKFSINGSTSNFSQIRLVGSGSSAFSGSGTANSWDGISPSSATASTFGNTQLYFPNYTSSTNKSFSIDSVGENNGTSANQSITALQWAVTDAITSISLIGNGGNLTEYSTASLYKITAD